MEIWKKIWVGVFFWTQCRSLVYCTVWTCCVLTVGDHLPVTSSQYTEDCHNRSSGRVKAVTAQSSSTACSFSNQRSSLLPYQQRWHSDGVRCQRRWASFDVQWVGTQRYVHQVATWQLQVGAVVLPSVSEHYTSYLHLFVYLFEHKITEKVVGGFWWKFSS